MKFSIIANPVNAYQFAVTVDGIHSGVEEIPTLTQAMHLTLAELKSAVSKTSGAITGNLVAPISPEIELWGAGVTYLRSRDARKEESGVPDVYQRVYEAAIVHETHCSSWAQHIKNCFCFDYCC